MPDTMNTVKVDDVWRTLGSRGLYQITTLVFVLFGYIQMSHTVLIHVFIGYNADFRCRNLTKPLYEYGIDISNNDTSYSITYGQCHVTVQGNGTSEQFACPNGYHFNSPHGQTIITEWDLVCDKQGLAELSQTLVIVGQIVGAILLSPLPDKYGRKPVMVGGQALAFCLCVAASFSPTFAVFCVLRFFVGVAIQCLNTTAPVMCLELFPTEHRGTAGVISNCMWSSGVLSLTLFGYFLRDSSWRYIQLASALSCVLGLLSYWALDESLRWLIANNRRSEAIKLVRKVAKRNNVAHEKPVALLEKVFEGITVSVECSENKEPDDRTDGTESSSSAGEPLTEGLQNKQEYDTPTDLHTNENIQNDILPVAEIPNDYEVKQPMNRKSNKGDMISEGVELLAEKPSGPVSHIESISFLDVFRNRKLLRNTLVLGLCWFSSNFGYMGLFLVPSPFTDNIYINYFINALVEFPGLFIILLLIDRIGRKWLVISCFCSAGVAIVATVSLLLLTSETNEVAQMVGAILNYVGKFAISGAVAMLYVYTPELYPTNVRNIGYGVTGCAARFGAMTSPFLNLLAAAAPWAPGVVFSTTFVLASCSLLVLPETKGKELPQTLQEFVSWEETDRKTKICNCCTS